jgi:hypothetical protein
MCVGAFGGGAHRGKIARWVRSLRPGQPWVHQIADLGAETTHKITTRNAVVTEG